MIPPLEPINPFGHLGANHTIFRKVRGVAFPCADSRIMAKRDSKHPRNRHNKNNTEEHHTLFSLDLKLVARKSLYFKPFAEVCGCRLYKTGNCLCFVFDIGLFKKRFYAFGRHCGNMHGDIMGKLSELLIPGNEICFRSKFQEYSNARARMHVRLYAPGMRLARSFFIGSNFTEG